MGFIHMNLGEVKEPKPVPAGRYNLTIASAEYKDAKAADKAPMIRVSIGIDEHPDAPNIGHFISLPRQGEEASKTQFKMLMCKRFLAQFGIVYNEVEGFNVEDLPGATASGLVELDEPAEDGTIYNRLKLDKLSTE